MKLSNTTVKILGLGLLSAFLFTGCLGEEDQQKKAQGQPQMPPAPAPFIVAQKQDVVLNYEYPARIVSSAQVAVMARVSGTLIEKNFTEGEFVKEGTVLFKIDPKKYQATVDKAKAEVAVAEATLKNAERNNKRVQALYKDKAVSEQEKDSALSAYEVAKAQLMAAKVQVNDAQIDLDYTTVEAPISGITGKKMQDVGDLVGSGETDSHLVTITRLDPVYVEFSIPDSDMEKIRPVIDSGSAQVILENGQTYAQEGQVDFVDKTIDKESGTIALRATFENPKSDLLPGQFVRILLKGAAGQPYFVIPQKAVMQSPQGSFVYVIKEGKAAFNPIQLGETQGTSWLIEGGLSEGQQVIIDNLMKIRPNAPVQPVDPQAKAQQKPGA